VKEAFPFAHLLGMPQIKAHATEAARRVVTTARNVVMPKTAKTGVQSPTFAELLEQPTIEAAAKQPTTEAIEREVEIDERVRGAEIMAAAIKVGRPHLGLALFESSISAERAIAAITSIEKDEGQRAAIQGDGANQSRIQKLTAMGAIQ
jgi:hypothetical protein